MPEEIVGKVSHFFAQPVVVGIEISGVLKVGDQIRVKGHTTDFQMVIESMQIENAIVQEAKPGDSVGIKVPERAREGDTVYRITD